MFREKPWQSKLRWKSASQICCIKTASADIYPRVSPRKSWSTNRSWMSKTFVIPSDSMGQLIKRLMALMHAIPSQLNMAMLRSERLSPSVLVDLLTILGSSQSWESSAEMCLSSKENTRCRLSFLLSLTFARDSKECHHTNSLCRSLKRAAQYLQLTQFLAPTLKFKNLRRTKTMSVTRKLPILCRFTPSLNTWSVGTSRSLREKQPGARLLCQPDSQRFIVHKHLQVPSQAAHLPRKLKIKTLRMADVLLKARKWMTLSRLSLLATKSLWVLDLAHHLSICMAMTLHRKAIPKPSLKMTTWSRQICSPLRRWWSKRSRTNYRLVAKGKAHFQVFQDLAMLIRSVALNKNKTKKRAPR